MKRVGMHRVGGGRLRVVGISAALVAGLSLGSFSLAVCAFADEPAASLQVDLQASYSYSQGLAGFAEYIGDTQLANVIAEAGSHKTVGPYNRDTDYTKTSNAFNLDNVKQSLIVLRRCNELRRQAGKAELRIDPYLMGVGAANANYSKTNIGHSEAYNVGENLAWGYSDPFTGWYDAEKQIWESDECDAARSYFNSVSGSFNTKLYRLSQQYPAIYSRVGHYLNIINDDYKVTGAAYVATGGSYGNTWEQAFDFSATSSKTYSVSEFTNLFNTYYNLVTSSQPSEQWYDVMINESSHGSVATNVDQAYPGDTVTITATPDEGYAVQSVTVALRDGTSVSVARGSNGTWTFTMPENAVWITVAFANDTHRIALDAGEHGSLSTETLQAREGDEVTVALNGDRGYTADKVTVTDGNGNTVPTTIDDFRRFATFTMPAADVTVSVTFRPYVPGDYKVYFLDSEGADLSLDNAQPIPGDTVTVIVTPDEGKRVTGITVTDAEGNRIATTAAGENAWSFTMPASDITVTPVLQSADEDPNAWSCDGGASCPSNKFSDVNHAMWYHHAIDWAVTNGVMNGYSGSDRFGTEDKLYREQAACVLYNYLGGGAKAADSGLSDVEDGKYYTDAINWVYANGVMNGYGDGTFGVGDVITREQLACLIANAVGAAGGDASALAGMPDADKVSSWAQGGMAWAVENGVINGVEVAGGGRELQPQAPVTRAQMAAVMMNVVEAGLLAR